MSRIPASQDPGSAGATAVHRRHGPAPALGQSHVVSISRLRPGISPRRSEDEEHVHRLAQAEGHLLPILVHRASMRVIDGMHRLRAAVLRGEREIEAIFFEGSEDDAFIKAVEENIAHGLPLPLADRKSAALRILDTHPDLSDRAVARHTGLATKTVAALRGRSTGEVPTLNMRLGSDGKVRPTDATEGRRHAAQLIAEQPETPLRKIAEVAGISLGTAHDVRRRVQEGEDPVPKGRRRPQPAPPRRPEHGLEPDPEPEPAVDPATLLRRLSRDPALRQSEPGRHLLQLLHTHTMTAGDWTPLIDSVPPHCASAVIAIARMSARSWQQMAQALEQRTAPTSAASRDLQVLRVDCRW